MVERTPPADAGGEPAFLVVATIRRPHGVRGELALTLETDHPGRVFKAGRVLRVGDARGRPTGRELTIVRARPVTDGMLLQAAELPSRDAEVEALRGHTLLIPAAEAAPPAEDEIFYHQLVGSAVLVAGERIGTVKELLETGGAQLLVVRREGAKELLVPFVKEMVRRIDARRREVEIDPPEGLLDL